ncbi:Fe-S cluster assembly sulfur transfer protein SufU [Marinithermus hydrothermalis]|uniref:SUF system FeS assembly protein, NifU family n=1 Tax=Marinithermus hydrothermalis (strain DSM 14884 / JCM 11576 / T1) TaxID=869210 RepID=F2NKH1_MARHT|nr:SUF system NifU family Fe-S cluster assembly protein [Marinithermus hydrothermalis]AEB12631.1 SUF system FeS assembly protein, NifU family [Marinithermus hydrothermalis DSM 14884]
MSLLDELYKEIILTHYKNPKNYGPLPDATLTLSGHNPSCGDQLELHLKLEDGRITNVTFSGQGCAISQASASMMTELIKGKPLAEALELSRKFKAMVVEGAPPAPELGDLKALSGVSKLHARVKCATLAWTTLEEAARQLEK